MTGKKKDKELSEEQLKKASGGRGDDEGRGRREMSESELEDASAAGGPRKYKSDDEEEQVEH